MFLSSPGLSRWGGPTHEQEAGTVGYSSAMGKRRIALVLVLAVACLFAFGGYLVGKSKSPDGTEESPTRTEVSALKVTPVTINREKGGVSVPAYPPPPEPVITETYDPGYETSAPTTYYPPPASSSSSSGSSSGGGGGGSSWDITVGG